MFCRLIVVGRCILIDFDRYLLCFCDHCVRLCVVFFIGCLVFSAFFDVLCYVNLRLCVGAFGAADIWWYGYIQAHVLSKQAHH